MKKLLEYSQYDLTNSSNIRDCFYLISDELDRLKEENRLLKERLDKLEDFEYNGSEDEEFCDGMMDF